MHILISITNMNKLGSVVSHDSYHEACLPVGCTSFVGINRIKTQVHELTPAGRSGTLHAFIDQRLLDQIPSNCHPLIIQ
jgi:hypothetical protein